MPRSRSSRAPARALARRSRWPTLATARDVMGGQVDLMFAGIVSSLSNIKGGKLRAYAVASKTRSVQLPDVPTMAELGFAEIDFTNWFGTVVSARMADDLVSRINLVTVKAATSPKVRERLIA